MDESERIELEIQSDKLKELSSNLKKLLNIDFLDMEKIKVTCYPSVLSRYNKFKKLQINII